MSYLATGDAFWSYLLPDLPEDSETDVWGESFQSCMAGGHTAYECANSLATGTGTAVEVSFLQAVLEKYQSTMTVGQVAAVKDKIDSAKAAAAEAEGKLRGDSSGGLVTAAVILGAFYLLTR